MTRNRARIRRLILALAAIPALLALYLLAGTIGGLIPANAGWAEPADGITIYVEDNGVHAGIVVPKLAGGVDWRPLAPASALRDPRMAGHGWLAIGWGERGFYQDTPTWADVRIGTILNAAIGSDATVMHVQHLPRPVPGPSVRAVTLRQGEYQRLATFIRAGWAVPGGPGRPGHFRSDSFFDGRGRYSAIHTCNAWVGEALRAAGVRVGRWTPFTWSVLAQLP
jgi:uncharacterized protein (TIGR02117 family)